MIKLNVPGEENPALDQQGSGSLSVPSWCFSKHFLKYRRQSTQHFSFVTPDSLSSLMKMLSVWKMTEIACISPFISLSSFSVSHFCRRRRGWLLKALHKYAKYVKKRKRKIFSPAIIHNVCWWEMWDNIWCVAITIYFQLSLKRVREKSLDNALSEGFIVQLPE